MDHRVWGGALSFPSPTKANAKAMESAEIAVANAATRAKNQGAFVAAGILGGLGP
jgi:hypothetical protein